MVKFLDGVGAVGLSISSYRIGLLQNYDFGKNVNFGVISWIHEKFDIYQYFLKVRI